MREAMIKGEALSPGRPREFDENVALTAIMEVFWAKGFEGASMSDLVAATGVKKGSLYAAFGDKRAMYRQALARYDRTWIDFAVRGLKGGGPPRTRIEHFLQSAASQGDPRGCFTCNASIDQACLDPASARLVRASLERLEAALREALAEIGDRAVQGPGGIGRQASHLMAVYFGLRVLAKAGAAPEVLDQAKDAALATLADR